MVDAETTVRTKFVVLCPVMNERMTRLWAGAEADALGDGGIAMVERATGLSRTTIRAGVRHAGSPECWPSPQAPRRRHRG